MTTNETIFDMRINCGPLRRRFLAPLPLAALVLAALASISIGVGRTDGASEPVSAVSNAQNDAVRSGPKLGEKVPDFELPDQEGHEQSLQRLMGTSGLLLVFVRSADW
jgi:hypothetical protein